MSRSAISRAAPRLQLAIPQHPNEHGSERPVPASREDQVALFRALHQYTGIGAGEQLGCPFTGVWSVMIGVGVTQGKALAP